jgi:hypothetical protein
MLMNYEYVHEGSIRCQRWCDVAALMCPQYPDEHDPKSKGVRVRSTNGPWT